MSDVTVENLMALGLPASLAEEILAIVTGAGNLVWPSATYSADHQIELAEYSIRMDASGGERTVWLPSLVSSVNRQYKVYRAREDATENTISIKTYASDPSNADVTVARIVFANDPLGAAQSFGFHNNALSWDVS